MSVNNDYFDLKALLAMRGYSKLQALWAHEYAKVMETLQKVAGRNNESSWRYQAGILRGFDLAIGQLDRAILQMEKEGEGGTDSVGTKTVEELWNSIKGESA